VDVTELALCAIISTDFLSTWRKIWRIAWKNDY